MGNTSIIYKLSDSFSLSLSALIPNFSHTFTNPTPISAMFMLTFARVDRKGQIQAFQYMGVSCDWSVFWKGILYSVEQTLVGGE